MAREYKASQELHLSGWECGTEIELKMTVDFTVTEYRAQTQIDPEEPSQVEDIEIKIFHGLDQTTIPSWLERSFTESAGFKDWLMSEANSQEEIARDDAADARRGEL